LRLPADGIGQMGTAVGAIEVLEPIFEPTFHPSSHGFRPHRGAHTAIAQAKEHLTAGYQMVLDIDLSKFFDRVHHQRLLDRIAARSATAGWRRRRLPRTASSSANHEPQNWLMNHRTYDGQRLSPLAQTVRGDCRAVPRNAEHKFLLSPFRFLRNINR
jgi:Reverse transcriptase (RNA-dependent DNA polymerase)